MPLTTVSEALRERMALTIKDRAKHAEILRSYEEAREGADTPENLQIMVACWARSEALWKAAPHVPTPPAAPEGGASIAMRVERRAAA